MTSQPTAEDPREDASLHVVRASIPTRVPRNDNPGTYHPPSVIGGSDDYYPSSFEKKKKKKTKKAKNQEQTKVPVSSNDDVNETTKIIGSPKSSPSPSAPSKLRIHGALATVQVIFGISAVVGSIGLPRFHPLTFALYRETSAAILLSSAAHVASVRAGRSGGLLSGSCVDFPIILMCGFGIFASQACYITGIKLSGAIAASVWQPSQPIITAAICMLLQWEPYNSIRVFGVIIAFFGCTAMVIGGGEDSSSSTSGEYGPSNTTSGFSNLIGQVFFFVNCLGSSAYVILSKRVLNTGRYESLAVTAWGYLIAASLMAISSSTLSISKKATNLLCSDCGENIWSVPKSAIPAMVWFVIMTSSSAYALMTWATKYATGTMVIGYAVIQPVASAILIQALISFGLYRGCGSPMDNAEKEDLCLDEPDRYTVMGALGVFMGLFIVIWTEPSENGLNTSTDGEEDTMNGSSEVESLLEMSNVSGKGKSNGEGDFGYKDDVGDLNILEGQD